MSSNFCILDFNGEELQTSNLTNNEDYIHKDEIDNMVRLNKLLRKKEYIHEDDLEDIITERLNNKLTEIKNELATIKEEHNKFIPLETEEELKELRLTYIKKLAINGKLPLDILNKYEFLFNKIIINTEDITELESINIRQHKFKPNIIKYIKLNEKVSLPLFKYKNENNEIVYSSCKSYIINKDHMTLFTIECIKKLYGKIVRRSKEIFIVDGYIAQQDDSLIYFNIK